MSIENKDKKEKKDNLVQVTSFFTKVENWYEANRKKVNVISTAVLVAVLLCIYIIVFWMPKRQQKAELDIFKAEQYFAQDSLRQALDGDGVYDGLLSVASRYRCTKTANRRHGTRRAEQNAKAERKRQDENRFAQRFAV